MKLFTLSELAEAMTAKKKIRWFSWESDCFIQPNKNNTGWVDESGYYYNPPLGNPSNWTLYEEPKPEPKTEMRTFYKPVYYDLVDDCVFSLSYQGGNGVVEKWRNAKFLYFKEKEFEVPVREV